MTASASSAELGRRAGVCDGVGGDRRRGTAAAEGDRAGPGPRGARRGRPGWSADGGRARSASSVSGRVLEGAPTAAAPAPAAGGAPRRLGTLAPSAARADSGALVAGQLGEGGVHLVGDALVLLLLVDELVCGRCGGRAVSGPRGTRRPHGRRTGTVRGRHSTDRPSSTLADRPGGRAVPPTPGQHCVPTRPAAGSGGAQPRS